MWPEKALSMLVANDKKNHLTCAVYMIVVSRSPEQDMNSVHQGL